MSVYVPESAKKLEDAELKNNPILGWSPERPHILEFSLGLGGFFGAGVGNRAAGKLFFSGIHKHFIGLFLGGYVGHLLYGYFNEYTRSQQLLYEEYARMHPEEFGEPEKKMTFGEHFRPWSPVR